MTFFPLDYVVCCNSLGTARRPGVALKFTADLATAAAAAAAAAVASLETEKPTAAKSTLAIMSCCLRLNLFSHSYFFHLSYTKGGYRRLPDRPPQGDVEPRGKAGWGRGERAFSQEQPRVALAWHPASKPEQSRPPVVREAQRKGKIELRFLLSQHPLPAGGEREAAGTARRTLWKHVESSDSASVLNEFSSSMFRSGS